MENAFGTFVRNRREELRENDREFSVRKVAARIGVEPSYLSKVERGEQPPPSEGKIVALAEVLDEDPDILLAMAGKVSSDLQEVIRKRPRVLGPEGGSADRGGAVLSQQGREGRTTTTVGGENRSPGGGAG